ncbi:MAG: hypothetical protein LLF94_01635, partial [Chlamydiales bacterium]|nr:hypothetical protein [Chlamydiales bacterium]
VFAKFLGNKPNQKDRLTEATVTPEALLDFTVPNGTITAATFAQNIDVSLQYVEAWLNGTGAVALYNLMEDAATAEICRAQLWQWIHHKAKFSDGTLITLDLFRTHLAEESIKLGSNPIVEAYIEYLVSNNHFENFLTTDAYQHLEG